MKVILKADVKGAGKKGELCSVSDGYARNFLFPRNLAMPASEQALNELKNREASKAHRIAEEKATAERTKEKLSGATVHIAAKAGTSGRLFGAVTAKEIAEEIYKQLGIELDKRKIQLKADIKSAGEYTAEIKLPQGVSAQITVEVTVL